jgi:hypothetical protein
MREENHTTLASAEKKAITHSKVMRILNNNQDLTLHDLACQLGMGMGVGVFND